MKSLFYVDEASKATVYAALNCHVQKLVRKYSPLRLNKHKYLTFVLPVGVAAIGTLLSLPAKAATLTTDASNDVILWNNAGLAAIRDTKPGPTVVARDLAILQTSIFDAWAAYDPQAIGTRLGNTLQRPNSENTLANKKEAVGYAAYRTLVDLFPTQKAKFDSLMTNLGYDPSNTSTNTSTAAGIGNVAAKALLDFRHNDGSNQLGNESASGIPYSDYTGYTPVNTPDIINDVDRWQPLRVPDGKGGFVEQKFLTPQWGLVTPFALKSGSQFRPPAPKTLESDPEGFKKEAQEVLDLSANLTDKQKAIAEYWADGPSSELPPGHWNLFAQFVSQRDRHTLDEDVKMFFVLDNALFDASIATWDAKRAYDSARPISAIHGLFNGQKVLAWGGPNQGTQLINGEDWQPYQEVTVVTPPFPEYTSGHSAFSAVGAEILKRFTGSDFLGASVTQKAGTFRLESGPATDITLSWDTFSDAADEAGMSRRYGGIHSADGDLEGRKLGRLVAGLAWDKAQSYISPKRVPEPSSVLGTLALGALGALALCKGKQKQHKSAVIKSAKLTTAITK